MTRMKPEKKPKPDKDYTDEGVDPVPSDDEVEPLPDEEIVPHG